MPMWLLRTKEANQPFRLVDCCLQRPLEVKVVPIKKLKKTAKCGC